MVKVVRRNILRSRLKTARKQVRTRWQSKVRESLPLNS